MIKAEPLEIVSLLNASNKPEDKFETQLLLPAGENRQGEGGLRTKGYFKVGGIIPSSINPNSSNGKNSSSKEKPLITVVTVVFNGEQFLEETILSVVNQTYDSVEYIIIDGGSTDGTLDVIKKYEYAIDYWLSEKDDGIYDAMNKAIDLATGKWINFMNSGDSFYNKNVLCEVFNRNKYDDFEILYGNHQVIYPSGRKKFAKAGKIQSLWKGSQFCHQATFVKTQYHKLNKFNLYKKTAADYALFYSAWKANTTFNSLDVIIARFETGGVSDVKRIESIIERWTLVKEIESFKHIYYCFLVLVEISKKILKKVLREM